ncbi:hypothetical protein TNCV_3738781 [Trichonephila clavipes]|nr:hypothetical protein TNCV_3738781 [Trichonephila clavipes]
MGLRRTIFLSTLKEPVCREWKKRSDGEAEEKGSTLQYSKNGKMCYNTVSLTNIECNIGVPTSNPILKDQHRRRNY